MHWFIKGKSKKEEADSAKWCQNRPANSCKRQVTSSSRYVPDFEEGYARWPWSSTSSQLPHIPVLGCKFIFWGASSSSFSFQACRCEFLPDFTWYPLSCRQDEGSTCSSSSCRHASPWSIHSCFGFLSLAPASFCIMVRRRRKLSVPVCVFFPNHIPQNPIICAEKKFHDFIGGNFIPRENQSEQTFYHLFKSFIWPGGFSADSVLPSWGVAQTSAAFKDHHLFFTRAIHILSPSLCLLPSRLLNWCRWSWCIWLFSGICSGQTFRALVALSPLHVPMAAWGQGCSLTGTTFVLNLLLLAWLLKKLNKA